MSDAKYSGVFNVLATLENHDVESASKATTKNLKYFISNNMLYHFIGNARIVVPEKFKFCLLFELHCSHMSGHLAYDKTYSKLSDRYFWPAMHIDAKKFIQQCAVCSQYKDNFPMLVAPMVPIDISKCEPFEYVGFDILGPFLPATDRANKYILVAMDYMSKWPEAIAVDNIESKTICEFLTDFIICRHGVPDKLISDQGTQLDCVEFRSFCDSFGIQHQMSTVYHPESNGLVERFNRTLLSMLRTLTIERSLTWDEFLQDLLFAYRSARHESTKYTPFEVIYGRSCKLPVDSLHSDFVFDKSNFDSNIGSRMFEIRQSARKNLKLSSLKKYFLLK